MTPEPPGRPLVSVVMVTYGGTQWITPAVEALAAHTDAPYELIIVDNASPPDTVDLLASLPDVTVILNQRNVGFGPGANQGVLHATGEYVCILNSDAFVEPGWLPPLIEVLEHDPAAGAVVPRLLHLDGSLQEAGGVVGCDGSTRALGDGDDAEALPYRFRRYVDYGSAACLLMRRSVFGQIGGFDPAYPLGYCEDVDLCFALYERGLRTVYEPRSRVRHVRWGSSSRLEAERRVFANQPILLARWRERIAGRPSFAEPPFRAHDILQARDAESLDRILIVSDAAWGWVGGGTRRPRDLAIEIARQWPDARVTFLASPGEAAAPGEAGAPSVCGLLDSGVEVAAEEDWDAWFEERRFHYSTVIVAGPATFERFDPLIAATQPQATRVYDLGLPVHRWAEDLLVWWLTLATGPTGTLPGRLRSLEAWGIESADVVACASAAGMTFARDSAPATPAVLVPVPGNGGPKHPPPSWDRCSGLHVTGSLPAGPRFGGLQPASGPELFTPLRWIVDELSALAPDLKGGVSVDAGLTRLGRWPGTGTPPEAAAGATARVILVPPPFVADPALLETGVPFVTWRGGAAGLDLGDLVELLVADDPAAMARLVHDLLESRPLWERVHDALLSAAQPQGAPASREALWAALAHCGLGPPRRTPRARLEVRPG
jgi:GT2 family glycosyltransferase